MKRFLIFAILFCTGLTVSAVAQSGQSPTMQQSTSVEDNRSANPTRPRLKKTTRQQRQRMETGLDTTLPKDRPRDRPRQRLRADSLRRGGATRVDTIR